MSTYYHVVEPYLLICLHVIDIFYGSSNEESIYYYENNKPTIKVKCFQCDQVQLNHIKYLIWIFDFMIFPLSLTRGSWYKVCLKISDPIHYNIIVWILLSKDKSTCSKIFKKTSKVLQNECYMASCHKETKSWNIWL